MYSKFDENGEEISHYGLFKDISIDSHKHMTRPIDRDEIHELVDKLYDNYERIDGI